MSDMKGRKRCPSCGERRVFSGSSCKDCESPQLIRGSRNNLLRDLTGWVSGKLTVVEATHERKHGQVVWRCLCECGNTFLSPSMQLAHRKVKSCGCIPRGAQPTHRLSGSPEYGTWYMMIFRCHNPESNSFKNYGAKGINVCDRWRAAFANFLADMGPRPSSIHTLDRKDNSRGYEPENCVWATRAEQSRNTSRNVSMEIDGKLWCRKDIAEAMGMDESLLRTRMKQGMTLEQAIRSAALRKVA